MTIKPGDAIPAATLIKATDAGPAPITTAELFGGRTVALFSVPGAFTPTCSAKHLPGFINNAAELAAKGVDEIVCISVNDAFVMGAWGKSAAADGKVTMIADGNAGAQTAARMLKAGIALEQGNAKEAGDLFAAVAADENAPQAMRDIATIREVATKYDTMKPADVIARLKPLAVPGKPFFGSAGELVAMAYLDQNKTKEAGAMFASIAKDESVPEGLRSRSRQMAGLYGVDAIEDVDKVLQELGSPQDATLPGAQ